MSLDDPDEGARLDACRAHIARHGLDAEVVACARGLLATRKLYVLQAILPWLDGEPDLPALLCGRLPETDWNRAWEIFRALSRMPDAAEHLVALARHPDAATRSHALSALGRIAVERELLVETVILALDDPDEHVRSAAAWVAGRCRLYEAEETLLARHAYRALGELRSEAALPMLLDAARGLDTAERTALEALHALESFGPEPEPRIEPPLLDLYERTADPFHRSMIVTVLAAIGTVRSVPVLESFLARDVRRLSKRQRKAQQRELPFALVRLRARAHR